MPTREEIIRAVASSHAIETDKPTEYWEEKLKSDWRAIDSVPPNQWILVWAIDEDNELVELPCVASWDDDAEVWFEPDEDPYEQGSGPNEWKVRWWTPLPNPPV